MVFYIIVISYVNKVIKLSVIKLLFLLLLLKKYIINQGERTRIDKNSIYDDIRHVILENILKNIKIYSVLICLWLYVKHKL